MDLIIYAATREYVYVQLRRFSNFPLIVANTTKLNGISHNSMENSESNINVTGAITLWTRYYLYIGEAAH